MKVKDLIERLQQFNPEATVFSDYLFKGRLDRKPADEVIAGVAGLNRSFEETECDPMKATGVYVGAM